MTERNTRIRGKQITTDTVEPTDLKATNSPSDGQLLTYDTASSEFQWEDRDTRTELRDTFDNGDLSGGILTITHNWALSAPYTVFVIIFDNNGNQILADEITGATNSVAVDLTSYGSISGTWGYFVVLSTIGSEGTFDNSDLSSGKLTITHSLGLSAPYTIGVEIFDDDNKKIIPDEITGSTNSVEIDLTSFGTISGTWGYIIIGI